MNGGWLYWPYSVCQQLVPVQLVCVYSIVCVSVSRSQQWTNEEGSMAAAH